jgi:hypothetical protein
MSALPLTRRGLLWARRSLLQPINRWYHSGFGRRDFNPNGVDVFAEDWDNLIILDACRYDTFARLHNLPGDLSMRESRASTTPEWIRANIDGRDLRDTVYITATPQIHRHEDINHTFYKVVDVWRDGWDNELRTVPPEPVAEAALAAAADNPHKRLLVHFLQPHYPFIGEIGRERFDYDDVGLVGEETTDGDREKFWDTVGTAVNDVPRPVVVEAYEENLRLVLPQVKRLLTELGGKTVITADHGEMIYERAWPVPMLINGHPGGIYTSSLVEVPWHVHTNSPRRQTRSAQEAGDAEVDSETVKRRLRDLGYA